MHRPTMYYYWLGRLVSPFNRLQHSGLKWLKPAKNKFTSCFRIVPSKFLFPVRTTQIVASISTTNFFNLIFGSFLLVGPTMRRQQQVFPFYVAPTSVGIQAP
jgi:hypothetical protein